MDGRGSSGVPEGWKQKKFVEIAEFRNGLNFLSGDGGEVVKIIGVADFQKHFALPSTDKLSQVQVKGTLNDDNFLRDDDLLFVRSNGNKELVGRCLLIKVEGRAISFSGFTIRARILDPNVLPEYAAFLFHSGLLRKQMLDAGGGTNISNLSQKLLGDLLIPVPPISEQRKLVLILRVWNNVIEQQTHLLELKRERKRGLMQQLLTGKVRFKEFEGLEWMSKRLGKLFTERNETGFNDLPLLSITRERGVIYRNKVERKDTSNVDKSKYLRICPGDIGYNTMRMWQGVSALSSLEGIISPAYTVSIPGEEVHAPYFSYLFKYRPMTSTFERFSQGLTSDTWNLKFSGFSEIVVSVPPLQEQQKIATVLSAADTELETLQTQLTALRIQKRGLMQQLLTGKTRVKLEDPVVAR